MADQDKRKTKAVILRELESIKGLLLDDDEIPLLQDVIDSAEDESGQQETLDGDDMAELQQAYRDLLQARGMIPELDDEEDDPPLLHDVEDTDEQSGGADTPTQPRQGEVQTSLFDTDDTPEEQPGTATPRRNSVTKASGENPFLPAHIRERLHGNRPPPVFAPIAPSPIPPSQPPPATTSDYADRTQLVEDVIISLLPEVEDRLRQTLLALEADHLRQLLDDESNSASEPTD